MTNLTRAQYLKLLAAAAGSSREAAEIRLEEVKAAHSGFDYDESRTLAAWQDAHVDATMIAILP